MSQEWLDEVVEDVIDPDQRIVDPHHHLWPDGGRWPYGLSNLTGDVTSGHCVERTVFIECGAGYRTEGPTHLLATGETEFVAGEAAKDPRHRISAIVAHADLSGGGELDEALDAHDEAGAGLFRGIRDAAAWDPNPEALSIPGGAIKGLYADEKYRAGAKRLGERSLTLDAWHYHHQNREFAAFARAVPNTVMVLDHFGTPLGVGTYAEHRNHIYDQWRLDIVEIAKCENVVAKLGGLAMPDNGFEFHHAPSPPTSDQFIELQGRYYRHVIETFGPERCMFESNFPVDRLSLSYRVLWNAFKKIAAPYSPDERDAMFHATATRVYRL